jgi:hypothetical protein
MASALAASYKNLATLAKKRMHKEARETVAEAESILRT